MKEIMTMNSKNNTHIYIYYYPVKALAAEELKRRNDNHQSPFFFYKLKSE